MTWNQRLERGRRLPHDAGSTDPRLGTWCSQRKQRKTLVRGLPESPVHHVPYNRSVRTVVLSEGEFHGCD